MPTVCILSGDLNFRIDMRRDIVIDYIQRKEYDALLEQDQLLKQMKSNAAFRLRSFKEAPIEFAPTYKYDRYVSVGCSRVNLTKIVGAHMTLTLPKSKERQPTAIEYFGALWHNETMSFRFTIRDTNQQCLITVRSRPPSTSESNRLVNRGELQSSDRYSTIGRPKRSRCWTEPRNIMGVSRVECICTVELSVAL